MPKSERPQATSALAAAILLLLTWGCSLARLDSVYVDVDRVLASESAPSVAEPPLPEPKGAAPAVVVKQAGLPATSTTDRTIQRLKVAKKLIAENRANSIASLSSLLKRIYLAQADDQIAKESKALQPEQDADLAAALGGLRDVFQAYGQERGPLLARLSILVRNTDLVDQTVPEHADAVTRANVAEANRIRAQIRQMDARYNLEAGRVLATAQKEIDAEIVALQVEAKKIREAAASKAVSEAESKANQTQISLDVQVKQLVPESLPGIPARQVTVPGSAPMPRPPADNNTPIFGSLEQRRFLVDRQVDIWIRTTNRKRSSTRRGARDATEEFLQWRSAHKVGL